MSLSWRDPDHPYSSTMGPHPLPPAPVTDGRFRSTPRTCRSLGARLRVRETHRRRLGGNPHGRHQAPRRRYAAKWRGSVAARGAPAAAGDAGCYSFVGSTDRAGEELIMKTFSFVIFVTLPFWPVAASAQLNVLISGGFSGAYEQ